MTNTEKVIYDIKKYVSEINQKFGFIPLIGFDPMYETRYSNFEYTLFGSVEEEKMHKKKLEELWQEFFQLSKEAIEAIEY